MHWGRFRGLNYGLESKFGWVLFRRVGLFQHDHTLTWRGWWKGFRFRMSKTRGMYCRVRYNQRKGSVLTRYTPRSWTTHEQNRFYWASRRPPFHFFCAGWEDDVLRFHNSIDCDQNHAVWVKNKPHFRRCDDLLLLSTKVSFPPLTNEWNRLVVFALIPSALNILPILIWAKTDTPTTASHVRRSEPWTGGSLLWVEWSYSLRPRGAVFVCGKSVYSAE